MNDRQKKLAEIMGFDLSVISEQAKFTRVFDCSYYPYLELKALEQLWPYSGKVVNLKPIGCNGYIKGVLYFNLSPDDYLTFEFYAGVKDVLYAHESPFGSIRFSANDAEQVEELFTGIYIILESEVEWHEIGVK